MYRSAWDGPLPTGFFRALGTRTGLINSIYVHNSDRDAPNVYQTANSRCNIEHLIDYPGEINLGAAGKGTSFPESMASCVGETLERYALCWPDEERLVTASYEELCTSDEAVVDFRYLDEFSTSLREQFLGPFDRDTETRWVAGTDLRSGASVYVPAQHVWNRVGPLADEPSRVFSSSSGVAAGPTITEALVRALCEAIERDGIMRTWWRQKPPKTVTTDDIPWLRDAIHSQLDHESLSIHLFECESVVDVPVYASALVNDSGTYPAFAMAGSASLDRRATIREAATEAMQGWPYLHDIAVDTDIEDVELETVVDDFVQNMLYYAQPENVSEVEFLFEGPAADPEANDEVREDDLDASDRLSRLVSALAAEECTPIAFDVTTDDVRQCGAHVVRVFVPEFVRLYAPAVVPAHHPAFENESITDKPHPYP